MSKQRIPQRQITPYAQRLADALAKVAVMFPIPIELQEEEIDGFILQWQGGKKSWVFVAESKSS